MLLIQGSYQIVGFGNY